MSKLFPQMYDSPESVQVVGGLSYCSVAFVVLPFTLSLFFFDRTSAPIYPLVEAFYQIVNFGCLLFIYRSYLADSWIHVGVAAKKVMGIALSAVAILAAIYAVLAYAGICGTSESSWIAFMGVLPMTGIEMMMLPSQFVLESGILAVLVLVFLGPITTACLYYATAFAPLCSAGHRLAAYLAVAGITAVPRFITYFTVWGGWKELPLYLAQLPIHLIACWTYQKANTIWAPIFTHAIANILCIGGLFLLRFAGYIG